MLYQTTHKEATGGNVKDLSQEARAPLLATLKDGRRISYAIYGDPLGRPVLALHGAPACRLMFAMADAPARALGLKLVAPDRPGYADTTPDLNPTLTSRAGWLVGFMDALGLDRLAVLAISGGSPYGVACAARLQDRVTGLALVSPMGPAADYAASPQGRAAPIPFLQRRFFLHLGQRAWLIRPGAAMIAALSRRLPRLIVGRSAILAGAADASILRRADVRAQLAQMMAEAFRNGGAGGVSDLAIFGRPWGVDYSAITAPSVLWQGTADSIVPVEAARYLARQLPDCRYVELPGAGHFWVIDHMAEVLAEVARFP